MLRSSLRQRKARAIQLMYHALIVWYMYIDVKWDVDFLSQIVDFSSE